MRRSIWRGLGPISKFRWLCRRRFGGGAEAGSSTEQALQERDDKPKEKRAEDKANTDAADAPVDFGILGLGNLFGARGLIVYRVDDRRHMLLYGDLPAPRQPLTCLHGLAQGLGLCRVLFDGIGIGPERAVDKGEGIGVIYRRWRFVL